MAVADALAAAEAAARVGHRRAELNARLAAFHRGKIMLVQRRRAEAEAVLREAYEVAHETGPGFHGPSIIGVLALAVDAPAERLRLLD